MAIYTDIKSQYMVCLLPSFNRCFFFNKGGTIDITVYEVKSGGKLQEVRELVWGHGRQDLQKMLTCIVGKDFLE